MLVGLKTVDFMMHKDLLCKQSMAFNTLLKKPRPLGNNLLVLDHSVVTVHYFNEWLYTGTIKAQDWQSLLDVYIFAEKYAILNLQDKVVNKMIQQTYSGDVKSPSCTLISSKWSELAADSPLRNLLVKTYADYGDTVETIKQANLVNAPVQFVASLAQTFYERAQDGKDEESVLWSRKCMWHVHDKEELCSLSSEDKEFEQEFFT